MSIIVLHVLHFLKKIQFLFYDCKLLVHSGEAG